MAATVETIVVGAEEGPIDLSSVIQPIDGDASGKNLLCMEQLDAEDIQTYIEEAYAAEVVRPNLSVACIARQKPKAKHWPTRG